MCRLIVEYQTFSANKMKLVCDKSMQYLNSSNHETLTHVFADGRSAQVLLWANVSLIDDCQRFYKDRFKPGMMCAGECEHTCSSSNAQTRFTIHYTGVNVRMCR